MQSCLAGTSAMAMERLRSFSSRENPISKEEKTVLLVFTVVVGFSIATAYHYVMGHYLHKAWPANTFLYLPEVRFLDFDLVVRQSAALDPFGEDIGGLAGTPFGQFIGYLFSVIRPASLRLPIFFASFFFLFIPMVKHYLYGLKSRLALHQLLPLFTLVFLTYPVLFALDRANFDLLVLPLLFLFTFAYTRQHYKTSTVFLALAIAVKPYTAVFLMVYVFDRRYRHSLLAILAALLLSAVSLSVFKDGLFVESQKYFQALSRFASDPSFGSQVAYTSDLFSSLTVLTKSVGNALGKDIYLPDHSNIRLAYAALAALAAIHLVVQLWQHPKPLWKTISVLTILILLLPFNTHDYRLIYLFVPMLMYVATSRDERHSLIIMILWGLLLVPKNYYRLGPEQNVGMVINPLLLMALLICILPDAFSKAGLNSTKRFICERVRAVGHSRRLQNARSG